MDRFFLSIVLLLSSSWSRFHPPLLADAIKIEPVPLLLPPPEASLALILLAAGSIQLHPLPDRLVLLLLPGRPPDRGCPPEIGLMLLPVRRLLAMGHPPACMPAAVFHQAF
jgi:hypothetical protein